MHKLPPLPAPLDSGPFTVAEAYGLGVPRSRLRRRDLVSPFRGVRTAGSPVTLLDRVEAYAPRLGMRMAFSHASAAVALGMWLPLRVRDQLTVDVLAVRPARPPRAKGVRGHFGQAATPVTLVRGLPVVAPQLAWLQLACILTLDELIAACDSLIKRRNPLCTREQLVAAVVESHRIPGLERARRAVVHIRSGADSAKETVLRLLLWRAGLPEPQVNAVVSRAGARLRFGDLVFVEWKVIAEYDGEQHRRDARHYARDIVRLEELAAEGWTVVRVLKSHLDDPEAVVLRVAAALRAHGWRGRVSRSQLWRRKASLQP